MTCYDYGLTDAQEAYDQQEPPEPEPVGQCTICGADIFEGAKVCMVDGEMICPECYEITAAERPTPDGNWSEEL